MTTKSFAERLQEKVEKVQKRQRDNYALYAQACRDQGVSVGQPIDIMDLIKKEKKEP